ncbi:MAG: hypothetical protein FJ146_05885 [Deltaproteobacteria bacterium]|nr:hypothetical protein [Deltaproteobacteria bacterium]
MNKQNVLVGLILSFVVNYVGWTYAIMPVRRLRLSRQFQIASEMARPARDRAIIRYKLKHGIFKPRPKVLTLKIWEWVYKIVVYSVAPGLFIAVLLRRKTFLTLPQGKPVLILTSLGLTSDICNLWWITPATYFYLAAIAFVVKSDPAAYPDPSSATLLDKARHWMDHRVEQGVKKKRRKPKS